MNDSIINKGDIVYASTNSGLQKLILIEGYDCYPCVINWGKGWEFRRNSHWDYDYKRLAYSSEKALFDKILANNGLVYKRNIQKIDKISNEDCKESYKECTGTSLIITVKKERKIKLNFNL